MLTASPTTRVFVAREPVDMRGSFDALAGRVRALGLDPLSAKGADNRTWEYERGAFSQVHRRTSPSGRPAQEHAYDAQGRLTSYVAPPPSGETGERLSFTYDGAGRLSALEKREVWAWGPGIYSETVSDALTYVYHAADVIAREQSFTEDLLRLEGYRLDANSGRYTDKLLPMLSAENRPGASSPWRWALVEPDGHALASFDGEADTELSWELLGAYGDVHVATGPSPWDRDGLHGAEGPRGTGVIHHGARHVGTVRRGRTKRRRASTPHDKRLTAAAGCRRRCRWRRLPGRTSPARGPPSAPRTTSPRRGCPAERGDGRTGCSSPLVTEPGSDLGTHVVPRTERVGVLFRLCRPPGQFLAPRLAHLDVLGVGGDAIPQVLDVGDLLVGGHAVEGGVAHAPILAAGVGRGQHHDDFATRCGVTTGQQQAWSSWVSGTSGTKLLRQETLRSSPAQVAGVSFQRGTNYQTIDYGYDLIRRVQRVDRCGGGARPVGFFTFDTQGRPAQEPTSDAQARLTSSLDPVPRPPPHPPPNGSPRAPMPPASGVFGGHVGPNGS